MGLVSRIKEVCVVVESQFRPWNNDMMRVRSIILRVRHKYAPSSVHSPIASELYTSSSSVEPPDAVFTYP